MWIWALIGIVCGITLGLGLALRMVVVSLKESNDIGDSKGSMRDFGATLNMMYSMDDLHQIQLPASGRGRSMLEMHCNAIETQYKRSV